MNAPKEFADILDPRRTRVLEEIDSEPKWCSMCGMSAPADCAAGADCKGRKVDQYRQDIWDTFPQLPKPKQVEIFKAAEPWTEEDCNTLADIGDEMFAELFLGDHVSALAMAECRHISSGQHNYKLKHTLLAFRGVDSERAEADKEKVGRTKRTIVKASKGVVLALVAGVLSGCVTYVHKFEPHQPSELCVHIAKCTVIR